jgi:putative ATPase
VGKTTLAELIARKTDSAFIRLSGVSSSVADIRKEIDAAFSRRKIHNRNTILFVDEIHRFSKSQQDVLLPDVESGNIRLIGATTYNPQFYVIEALLSRSLLFELKPLISDEIKTVINRALSHPNGYEGMSIDIDAEALDFIANYSEGDARKALTALEFAIATTNKSDGQININLEKIESSVQTKSIGYSKNEHYDTISAYIKSMRGSDPNAAVYWLAKMLHAGEDIRFIARRLIIFAAEDIGNADPRAIQLTNSTFSAVEKIGMPEARIILSQATIYCATAPKSNASYLAIDKALDDVKNSRTLPVPMHLKDAHYKGAKDLGAGVGYQYPHNSENSFVDQEYLGVSKSYYQPKGLGYESKIVERMQYWGSLRGGTSNAL